MFSYVTCVKRTKHTKDIPAIFHKHLSLKMTVNTAQLESDVAGITKTTKMLKEKEFEIDMKLFKSLDAKLNKAIAAQEELVIKQTVYVKGLEDEADQALENERVNCVFVYCSMFWGTTC